MFNPVDNSLSNTVEQSDDYLTEDEWILYNERIWKERESSDSVFNQIREYLLNQSKVDYEIISTSELIANNFLSWPENIKKMICDFISYKVTISNIEAYLDLLFKFQEYGIRNNMDCDFLNVSAKDLSMTLAMYPSPMSNNFQKSVDDYCNFHQRDPLIYRNVYYMLAFVYGDERVIEISTKWIQNTASKEISDFICLFERWEEYKEYPIEWAIEVANKNMI